jgi:serine protease Do
MLESEKQTISVVKKLIPSVVSIVVSKLMPEMRAPNAAPPFGPFGFFGLPNQDGNLPDGKAGADKRHIIEEELGGKKELVKVGGGSGFIVDANGLVLTNKHVVFDPEAEYTVVTSDDKEYPAHVISRDPVNDVAVLKIDAKGLPPVTIGNSDKIELGQTVIAIGNALGQFTNTVSKGIISGLGRKISASLGGEGEMENLRNVIQTDVAINQGNSGGPLISMTGEVVGINTAIIYGAQNIGFSLPINWAKADLADIRKFGRIIRPYIGLRYIVLNPSLQQRYSLPVDYGALVMRDHAGPCAGQQSRSGRFPCRQSRHQGE